MKRTAACIVTYNRKEKLKNCLRALLAQTVSDFDLILVDNASTDGTGEMVRAMRAALPEPERIRYYNTGANLGGAGGFQFAVKKAVPDYEYLWLMDDDTYPREDCLARLLEAVEGLKGRFGFLSSLSLWRDGSVCLMNRQHLVPDPLADAAALQLGLLPVEEASFVSLFVPAAAVRKKGLPIKEFFIWGDDAEYTRRLSPEGGYLVPRSVVIHDMERNDGIDIARNPVERNLRYPLCARNRLFIARQFGKVGQVLHAYGAECKQIFRVLLFAKDHRMKRIRLVLQGIRMGLRFHPAIEYVAEEAEGGR